jgi:hypothetical protein
VHHLCVSIARTASVHFRLSDPLVRTRQLAWDIMGLLCPGRERQLGTYSAEQNAAFLIRLVDRSHHRRRGCGCIGALQRDAL